MGSLERDGEHMQRWLTDRDFVSKSGEISLGFSGENGGDGVGGDWIVGSWASGRPKGGGSRCDVLMVFH